MTKFPTLILAVATAFSASASDFDAKLSPIDSAYAATSVNAAVFRASSVASHGGWQYASFYDPEGHVTLAKRPLGTDNWTVEHTPYTGNVRDGHNIISLGIDSQGYLHVAFDHHGHPLHYARSVAPGSLTLGPLQPMVGRNEADVTYPEFYPLSSGKLLFVYRSGFSGGGNMVLNVYDPATAKWERLHDVLLDGQKQRNAYWQLCVAPDGTIHLSWVWRETWMVETNHDLCYARSLDGGLTWQRSDGTPYSLPITAETAEVAWPIPQKSELINQTSMTTTSEGRPMIATYWREQADSIPTYRLVEHDGNQWRMSTVYRRSEPFSLSGGGTKMIPMSRPRLVSRNGRTYYVFRDAERGSRVSMAYRHAPDAPWQVTDLTTHSVGAWEPSLDYGLWHSGGPLDIYVQRCAQGDGERTTNLGPQPACVLSVPVK